MTAPGSFLVEIHSRAVNASGAIPYRLEPRTLVPHPGWRRRRVRNGGLRKSLSTSDKPEFRPCGDFVRFAQAETRHAPPPMAVRAAFGLCRLLTCPACRNRLQLRVEHAWTAVRPCLSSHAVRHRVFGPHLSGNPAYLVVFMTATEAAINTCWMRSRARLERMPLVPPKISARRDHADIEHDQGHVIRDPSSNAADYIRAGTSARFRAKPAPVDAVQP